MIWGAMGRLRRGGAEAAPSTGVSRLEQRIGQIPVAGGPGVLRPHAFDLGLEQFDALQQLGLRVAVERFASQPAGGIAADPGEIVLHARRIEFAPLAVNGPRH